MSTGGRTVTVRDVAERACVSAMTVSRVLAGGAAVRPARRERVMEAARALGYASNEAARALSLGRGAAAVALVYRRADLAFLEALGSALGEAKRLYLRLLLVTLDREQTVACRVGRVLATEAPAVLLADCEPALEEALRAAGLLVIGVAPDEGQAAAATAARLIGAGHRRIGMVVARGDAQRRASLDAGFAAAHGAAGIALPAGGIAEIAGRGQLLVAAEAALAQMTDATAMIAGDPMLADVLRHLTRGQVPVVAIDAMYDGLGLALHRLAGGLPPPARKLAEQEMPHRVSRDRQHTRMGNEQTQTY